MCFVAVGGNLVVGAWPRGRREYSWVIRVQTLSAKNRRYKKAPKAKLQAKNIIRLSLRLCG